MRTYLLLFVFIFSLSGLSLFAERGLNPKAEVYARIDIAELSTAELDALKAKKFVWWSELDQVLLVRSDVDVLASLKRAFDVTTLDMHVDDSKLVIVSAPHGIEQDEVRGVLLAEGGRRAVFSVFDGYAPEELLAFDGHDHGHSCGTDVSPFVANQVLAAALRTFPAKADSKKRKNVDTIVSAVDGTRWLCDVIHLATYDREVGKDGLADAGNWLVDEFSALSGMEVSKHTFTFAGEEFFNVVGRLEGTTRPEDIYIVGAHYDSTASRDGGATAPGAEDNASGTAAVLEMARLFSVYPPEATIIFVAFSVEERGLVGSSAYAQVIVDDGLSDNVKGVLTMDMIGFSEDDDLDVLIEGPQEAAALMDELSLAAGTYTQLRVITSFNPFGSDHVPFINRGMPALLSIQNDWNLYPGYHRSTDTADNIVEAMGLEILKMNVAALAKLAAANTSKFSGPVFTGWANQ